MADLIPAAAPDTAASAAPTTGLLSAAEALAQADSSPATEDSTASSTAPTTAAPAESSTTDTTPAPEPPKWRWQDILENTRKKTAEEVEARVRQEFASVPQEFGRMTPQERAGLLTWQRALSGDLQARAQIAAAVQQSPELAEALSGLMPNTARAADPEVQPQFMVETGEGVAFDPARFQQWQAWHERQLLAKFEREIAPLKQTAASVAQERAAAQAYTTVSQAVNAFRADEQFAAHEADVKAVIQSDPDLFDLADRNPKLALEVAYQRVYREKILPTTMRAQEQAVVSSLKTRAAAGSPNPGTAGAATPTSTIGDARAALRAAGIE